MLGPFTAKFLTSSYNVYQNAFKNILFRVATITLDYVILRVFCIVAFWRNDYTSFLMFAENVIQKVLFISSRGFTARQSLLVGAFALIAAAGSLYDTMLWAIDNPGFILKHRAVDAASLASQLVKNPAYVVLVSANLTDPTATNTLNGSVVNDLYTHTLNFSLPGINRDGVIEVAPPLYPLNPLNATARIWLDGEGFAVGLDPTTMSTLNMLRNVTTACFPFNDPTVQTDTQAWNCNVPNSESLGLLQLQQGSIPIWWDTYHADYLLAGNDNPWSSLGSGIGSVMMKQVFTVTKGLRRHTFKSTVIKASMTTSAPRTLEDGEISDFMRRTWSPDGTITTAVQGLIDIVLHAKGNGTGRTFGDFVQTNTSLLATSTDYLIILNNTGGYDFSALRFAHVNTTLIRSETLTEAPTPFEPCPGVVYRNTATGGGAISSSCHDPELINQTLPLDHNLFLGQMDASTVGIFTSVLGDGSSNLSSVALTDAGLDWISQQGDYMDRVLLSRAMILGGDSSAVTVDVQYSTTAISGLQLVLCILPAVLAILAWLVTRAKSMSYYKNSFFASVLTTTQTTTVEGEDLGHIRSVPEITLQRRGRNVTLGTPYGGTILNTVPVVADVREMAHEPLVLGKEGV